MKTFEIIDTIDGSVTLNAIVIEMGSDLLVSVTGGHRPHIGSASVSVSRPSLADLKKSSSTTSTINLTGHKDNIVGDRIAAQLSTILRTNVVVACGIHFDNIGAQGIDHVLQLSEKLANQIIEALTE